MLCVQHIVLMTWLYEVNNCIFFLVFQVELPRDEKPPPLHVCLQLYLGLCYHTRRSTWRERLYVREVKLRETFCMDKSNDSYN